MNVQDSNRWPPLGVNIPDDPFGEDGNCMWCGYPRWKFHGFWCAWCDADETIRAEKLKAADFRRNHFDPPPIRLPAVERGPCSGAAAAATA